MSKEVFSIITNSKRREGSQRKCRIWKRDTAKSLMEHASLKMLVIAQLSNVFVNSLFTLYLLTALF